MKKARRTLAVLSAAALVLLAGCGAKTPQQVYAEAVKKQSELGDMRAVSDIDMDVTAMGISMSVAMAMDTSVTGYGQPDMEMLSDMSLEMMGMTIDMTSYYADGWMYMDAMGTKQKMEVPLEQATRQQLQLDLSGLEESALQDLTMEDGDEGAKVLHFTVDGQLLLDSLEQITAEMGQKITADSLGLCDITLTVNKEGYFRQMDFTVPITLNSDGTTTESTVTVSTEFVDPGQPVEITPPADLDSYPASGSSQES